VFKQQAEQCSQAQREEILTHHIKLKMKIGTLITFIFWIGSVLAQSSFYIKPSINLKSNFSSTSQSRFFNNTFPDNPYLVTKNKVLTPLKNVNFGLSAGYFNSNLNLSIDVGYSTDECSTFITEHFYSYNTTEQKFNEQNLYFGYFLLVHNFGINVYQYYENDWFVGLGLRMLRSSANFSPGLNTIDNFSISSIDLDTNKTLSIDRSIIASRRATFNLQFILGKKLTIKDIYLFDLELIVSKSFNHLIYSVNNYSISDNGFDKTYMTANFGKSSGIFFQISRKIQILPWNYFNAKNK
jgi:hypothetical protein